jgi:hypothetical protein
VGITLIAHDNDCTGTGEKKRLQHSS